MGKTVEEEAEQAERGAEQAEKRARGTLLHYFNLAIEDLSGDANGEIGDVVGDIIEAAAWRAEAKLLRRMAAERAEAPMQLLKVPEGGAAPPALLDLVQRLARHIAIEDVALDDNGRVTRVTYRNTDRPVHGIEGVRGFERVPAGPLTGSGLRVAYSLGGENAVRRALNLPPVYLPPEVGQRRRDAAGHEVTVRQDGGYWSVMRGGVGAVFGEAEIVAGWPFVVPAAPMAEPAGGDGEEHGAAARTMAGLPQGALDAVDDDVPTLADIIEAHERMAREDEEQAALPIMDPGQATYQRGGAWGRRAVLRDLRARIRVARRETATPPEKLPALERAQEGVAEALELLARVGRIPGGPTSNAADKLREVQAALAELERGAETQGEAPAIFEVADPTRASEEGWPLPLFASNIAACKLAAAASKGTRVEVRMLEPLTPEEDARVWSIGGQVRGLAGALVEIHRLDPAAENVREKLLDFALAEKRQFGTPSAPITVTRVR